MAIAHVNVSMKTVYHFTIACDAAELAALQSMVQNPVRKDEPLIESQLREAIFTAIQKAKV
jgi:hypothetical protein